MVSIAVSFVVFALFGTCLCADAPCSFTVAYGNLLERFQRLGQLWRQHRADSWRVVRLVLSVLAFTMVSQLLLIYASKVPSSAEKVSWSAASAPACSLN